MRPSTALLAVAFSTAIAASCHPGEHVKGAGPVVRKAITVSTFHGVDLAGSLDVMITQGPVQQVEVEAQANIAELLTTEVRNGICHITTNKNYSTDKTFIVHITVPAIDHVEVTGSGDVKSTSTFNMERMHVGVSGSGDVEIGVAASHVEADLRGSGEIKLTGTTTTLDASVKGSGDIKAGGLRSDAATAKVTGSGDITVQAMRTLNAHITGSGDVKYKGALPTITSSVTGSGEVRSADE